MGLSADAIRTGLDAIAAQEPGIARALTLVGYPEPRIRNRGYATMLRTIVGQQVSVAAAASMWTKLTGTLGEDIPPDLLLAADFDALRACGLSPEAVLRPFPVRTGDRGRSRFRLPARR
jgi:DNA-3-methyladenine glycosylase II